jgi:hypothetical protein
VNGMTASTTEPLEESTAHCDRGGHLDARHRLVVHPAIGLTLLAIGVVIPALVYAIRVRGFTIMNDELEYLRQAVHVSRTGGLVGVHDAYYNSPSQLLPLISAPVVGLVGLPGAIEALHALAISGSRPALIRAGKSLPVRIPTPSGGARQSRFAARDARGLPVALRFLGVSVASGPPAAYARS